MKRVILFLFIVLAGYSVNSQTLEDIVRQNYHASGQEAFANAKSIRITARAYQGGMEIPMTISMKSPGKVRVEMSLQGMSIIQAYDGTRGYMINPMMGSSEPVELSASDASTLKNQANFTSNLSDYLKNNRLEMAGESTINGNQAWKLKTTTETGDVLYVYIDKVSFLQVKSDMSISQMGTEMNIEIYVSDYTDFSGLKFPKTTTTYANGNEMAVIMVEKVETNLDLADNLFTIK
ncbi:MAG: hypothetical protein FJY11_05785 [Bacteroidetes bacterium]|nr:hypothetical protein [Bacteroidota bacterium]